MSKKILLIEDMPVIQELYGDYLTRHGFEVDIASDGKSALVLANESVYDFVLVDLLLPEVNGIKFLEEFKNRSENTNVIVLSDFSEPSTYKRAHELGIKEYLIKAENTPSELVEKLNSYQ